METLLNNAVLVTPSTKIRFKCSGCGECCRHVKESVSVSSQDVFYLTKYLRDTGLENYCTDQFLSSYADPALLDESGFFVYFLRVTGEEDACIFLKENRCTVQKAKPMVCKMYPFMTLPNESGGFQYMYHLEQKHHFRGPIVETKKWAKQNFPQESRAFLQEEYASVGIISQCLKRIPENRKTEALLHFHRLRYSEFDLDQPFLEQFKRNQAKLQEILLRMAEE